MNAVAKLAFESISIKKRHEKLKVRFLPVVGGCRHQKKMASQR